MLSIPNSHAHPPPAPNGLGLIQPELAALGVSYVGMVNFNKQVYIPYYMGIIKSLLFGMPAPGGSPGGSSSTAPEESPASPATNPVASK